LFKAFWNGFYIWLGMNFLNKRRWVLLLGFVLMLRWLFGSPEGGEGNGHHGPDLSSKADSLIEYATSLKGTPYRFGGTDPKTGFDCSGFVYHVMQRFAISVPRASRGYANFGQEVEKSEAQPGDVIVFTGTAMKGIGHVGIIISEKGGPIRFVHASSARRHPEVVVTYLNDYYTKRFVSIRRVLPN